jgi:hypothetical protein
MRAEVCVEYNLVAAAAVCPEHKDKRYKYFRNVLLAKSGLVGLDVLTAVDTKGLIF